jgi:hypothetical protein
MIVGVLFGCEQQPSPTAPTSREEVALSTPSRSPGEREDPRVPKGTEVILVVPTGTGPVVWDGELVLTYTGESGESIQGEGRGCLQAQLYTPQTVVFADAGSGAPTRVRGALTLYLDHAAPSGPIPPGTRVGNVSPGFQCMIGSDFLDWYRGTVQ